MASAYSDVEFWNLLWMQCVHINKLSSFIADALYIKEQEIIRALDLFEMTLLDIKEWYVLYDMYDSRVALLHDCCVFFKEGNVAELFHFF